MAKTASARGCSKAGSLLGVGGKWVRVRGGMRGVLFTACARGNMPARVRPGASDFESSEACARQRAGP